MATTDLNGMVFFQDADIVTPLQNNFNAISTAVSNSLNGTTRIFRVANQAARDALLTARGASAANPLVVDRADTGDTERNATGLPSGWLSNGLLPYTPTLVNLSVGTGGSAQGIYSVSGKWLTGKIVITLGTGFSLGGPYVGLPIVPGSGALNSTNGILGSGIAVNSSGDTRASIMAIRSGVTVNLVNYNGANLNNTNPFAFNAGSRLEILLSYGI